MSFNVDETPTPTKLLEKLEKDGVFQDLGNVNPFDEQFRKATERGSHMLIQEQTGDRKTEDVLNTPIFPPFSDASSRFSSYPSVSVNEFLVPPTPVIRDSLTPEPDNRLLLHHNAASCEEEISDTTPKQRPPRLVKQTSVIVCPPGVEHPLSHHHNIHQDDNQNVVDTDLLFRLTSSHTDAADLKKDSGTNYLTNGDYQGKEFTVLTAKEKLKQILRKEQPDDTFNLNRTQIFVGNVPRHFALNTDCLPSTEQKKRRRSGATLSDEDVDEKKRASLERNRAAAQRSRLKRKHQMMEMKKSNDLLAQDNRRMKEEASSLKHEIAQLKCFLLAHEDCSVTRDILEGRLSVELPRQEKPTRLPSYVNIRPVATEEPIQNMIVVLNHPSQPALPPKVTETSQSVIVGPRRPPVQQYKIVSNCGPAVVQRVNQ